MPRAPSRKNARPGANIAEVAARAGVSKAAVSRVLNKGYASETMRAKVRAAMEELDYSPSAAAMNFASGRTGVIAVVANYIDSEWIPLVLKGIEKTLTQDRRASLLLGSLTHDSEYDPSTIRSWIDERRVDGAIFLRPRTSERPLIQAARKNGIAYATIAADINSKDGFQVRSDNVQGGRLLAEHLIDLGHKRFAYIGGEEHSRDSQERLKGISAAIKEHKRSLPARDVVAGVFEPREGRAYAARWLKRKPASRPSAVICADDTIAMGFIGAVLEAGVSIPKDVSVTGFNDLPALSWIWPGITTVSQDLGAIGERACEYVLSAVSSAKPQPLPKSETFPVRLVIRQTTGSAPRK